VPGEYTAVIQSVNETSGVGLVEVLNIPERDIGGSSKSLLDYRPAERSIHQRCRFSTAFTSRNS